MTTHLHTVCWNDMRMLEFFFRHYEPWVDHFFFFDDGSADGTREYLERHPRVTVESLQRHDPESWVLSAKHIYDGAWKRSRGQADWVIVTNIDEHLFHPDVEAYLAGCRTRGISAIPALGYQMVSLEFPAPDSLLARDLRRGTPWEGMSKLGIFDPDRIDETNFAPGRHRARFEGDVRFPERDEVLNLHYKYLGFAYTAARHVELRARLGKHDRVHGWGHKYSWDEAKLSEDLADALATSIDVCESGVDHESQHLQSRWWR